MTEIALIFTDAEVEGLKDKWVPEPGIYRFRIDDAELKSNKNNKDYIDLTVTILYGNESFECFGNVYTTPESKWKYGLFLKCIGLDLKDAPFTLKQFMNREGVGTFHRGDAKYMRLQEFITRESTPLGPNSSVAPKPKEAAKTSSIMDDDTPF